MLDNNRYAVPAYPLYHCGSSHAFAARFYLFKQDWTKVVTYATLVFYPDNNITRIAAPQEHDLSPLTYLELFRRLCKSHGAGQPAAGRKRLPCMAVIILLSSMPLTRPNAMKYWGPM